MTNSKKILECIKLALNYSQNHKEIYIHEPEFIGSNAYKYIKDCLDSGWVSSSGDWVKKFEKSIETFTESKYAIAVSNGTVALRLALFLVGVREGDEVLIPPLSFVATANAVSHLNAFPHFIDIDSESLGMCPKALQKRLEEVSLFKNGSLINKNTGRRISAAIPVHVYGLPAKILEIKKICKEWRIPLVEDAAEALGSRVQTSERNIHCGCFGDIGILSFNGNKIITTGGGGALLTNKKSIASLARHLSTTAKAPHPWDFYHDNIAWNDRLPNINAALGSSQMEIIENKIKNKRRLHSKYIEYFRNIENVEIIKEANKSFSNYWLITMRLKGDNAEMLREKILKDSHESKIFLRPSWILLNELPMYKNASFGDLSEAQNQSMRLLNLPSSPQLIK